MTVGDKWSESNNQLKTIDKSIMESIFSHTLLSMQLEDNNSKKRFTDSIYASLS